jgi:hypothetical protein
VKHHKKRWFRLNRRAGVLEYYSNPNKEKVLGMIDMRNIVGLSQSSGANEFHTFEIKTSYRTFVLGAKSGPVVERWLANLRTAWQELDLTYSTQGHLCSKCGLSLKSRICPNCGKKNDIEEAKEPRRKSIIGSEGEDNTAANLPKGRSKFLGILGKKKNNERGSFERSSEEKCAFAFCCSYAIGHKYLRRQRLVIKLRVRVQVEAEATHRAEKTKRK